MKSFFIIANEEKEESIHLSKKIKEYMEAKGCKASCYTGYANSNMIAPDTECIMVLGGDGTLLKAARELVDLNIPFVGVNLGHLGFLAEATKDNIYETIDKLIKEDYTVENRMMLVGEVERDGEIIATSVALNDIVVNRGNAFGIMDFDLYVNGLLLSTYKADGMIVATPTGSTAYSMSAGGPIVEPSANLMVVTAICPHTLNTRSIVLDSADVIELVARENRKSAKELGNTYFDGENMSRLYSGDKVIVRKSHISTKIIKLNSVGFLEILGKKMSGNENSETK